MRFLTIPCGVDPSDISQSYPSKCFGHFCDVEDDNSITLVRLKGVRRDFEFLKS